MESIQQFWIGLACAIPLSIAANLFTPKVQDWLSRRSRNAAQKRQLAHEEEFARIKRYANDPTLLNTFLLTTVLVTTMLGSGIGVFVALVYILDSFAGISIGTFIAQSLSVLGGVIVTKLCMDGLNVSIKVRAHQRLSKAED